MLSALAALAPRLGLDTAHDRGVEETAKAVVDALGRGDPFDRWLLVFDEANSVEMVEPLRPRGCGHVVLTSRNSDWAARDVTCVEVDLFMRNESHMFLRRRIPGITADDSDALADRLGDLPLALEVAGALQGETGMPQDTYLEELEQNIAQILGEESMSDAYFGLSLAASWKPTAARLRSQSPHAVELLQLCAFLGTEPISLDLLRHGARVLGSPLGTVLDDGVVLNRAVRELSNYGLIQLNQRSKSMQISRLNALIIRNDHSSEEADQLRHQAHLLLAAANPGEPENPDHHAGYAAVLAHVDGAGVWDCSDERVRRLALDVARYLRTTGAHAAVRRSAKRATEAWVARLGPDHPDVHTMAGYGTDVPLV